VTPAQDPLPGQAPLLSIILPVSGVEEYLPGCLGSVFGQPGPPGGVEVIAVDDASPDSCGAILDDWARREPRLRVIHLPRPAGPGPARMRGLAEAAGDFVWFVDPDDLLTQGCLAWIAGRLRDHRPDVLMLGYRILQPSGRSEPGPGPELLAGAGVSAITLADRPALINRTMTSWSKVLRRSFLAGLGVTFPPGIHEDIGVSCAALLTARRIVLLDRECYLYRRRGGSFLATPSRAHFAIFSSYEQVFALMDARRDGPERPPVTPAVRAAVFGRAIEHYSTVLANGLVPRSARREFFRRMTRDFHRYLPPGYHRPAGLRGLKIALIGRGAYRAYEILGPLNSARVALRRTARALTHSGAAPPGPSHPPAAPNCLPDRRKVP
jgi:CDP-glycerol glycerophosphotransferase